MFKQLVLASAVALSVLPIAANAQIKIGVTISTTGPAASLGIPEKMAFAIMPKEIAGQKVDYIILDDASDPVAAVKNTRKFVSEDKVDLIAGSSTTPASLAMIDVAADSKTPMISIASSITIVDPVDAKRFWVFKTPQTDAIMLTAVTGHMADHGVKTVGLIGFNDAYGEGVMKEFNTLSSLHHLQVVAEERYKRNDTSVIGQVLKIMEAHPDAVLIAASGTPGALPATTLRDRGYKGKIYFTDGIINQDFLRVGGKAVDGAFLPAGPFVVAKQLPDSNPIKKVSLDFINRYDAAYPKTPPNSFSAHAWNVYLLLKNAIPVALKTAKPGTEAFRSALRDALENTTNLVTTHGIMNMSKTDHMGFDQRSRVMVEIVNGQWKLVK